MTDSLIRGLLRGVKTFKIGRPGKSPIRGAVADYERFVEASRREDIDTYMGFATRGVFQPHVPVAPGYPGVVFLGHWLSEVELESDYPWLTMLDRGDFEYLGTYRYVRLPPLTREQWLTQPKSVLCIFSYEA